jgi:hypothetical protein
MYRKEASKYQKVKQPGGIRKSSNLEIYSLQKTRSNPISPVCVADKYILYGFNRTRNKTSEMRKGR